MINPELIKSFLIGKSFISEIHFFDELESTNDFAKKNKIQDGSLIITNNQTAGRGRLERKWQSEKDKNLTFSIFKDFGVGAEDRIVLVYYAAYSVYSVIEKLLVHFAAPNPGISLTIKWPNDVLLNRGKIAGVLAETVRGGNNVVIGVGLNVNQESFSDETPNAATSILLETGKKSDLNKLLMDIIIEFDKNLQLLQSDKFKEIFSLWKNGNKYLGEVVTYLTSAGIRKKAKAEDITLDGRLILVSDGQKCSFSPTEISLEF